LTSYMAKLTNGLNI